MTTHLTLKRKLVHPKDKRTPKTNAWVVYQVPSKNCPCVYTDEMERTLSQCSKKECTKCDLDIVVQEHAKRNMDISVQEIQCAKCDSDVFKIETSTNQTKIFGQS